METIQINPILFNSMVNLYSESAVKKLIKSFNKNEYITNLACKTAIEFDKISRLIILDKIIEFISLQIIIRTTADDINYSNNITDKKDILIQETGLIFNNDVINEIKNVCFNDTHIKATIQEYAIKKIFKLYELYDSNIVYLTKAFITAVKNM